MPWPPSCRCQSEAHACPERGLLENHRQRLPSHASLYALGFRYVMCDLSLRSCSVEKSARETKWLGIVSVELGNSVFRLPFVPLHRARDRSRCRLIHHQDGTVMFTTAITQAAMLPRWSRTGTGQHHECKATRSPAQHHGPTAPAPTAAPWVHQRLTMVRKMAGKTAARPAGCGPAL